MSEIGKCARFLLLLATASVSFAADGTEADLERRFARAVRPFLQQYCATCHSGAKAPAQLDLTQYANIGAVAQDYQRWRLLREKLAKKAMPPAATPQPAESARQQVIEWVDAALRSEESKNAGDPGTVLARRLSNAEYNYTIRDLTGADMRPAKEFPIDPSNPAGFDNSGESLDMSPALLNKYLQAAREVANHLVLKPDGIAFAPGLALAETDRDEYCIDRILDFYRRQNTDYADFFFAAWQFRHRAALGKPNDTLARIAGANRLSAKYLETVWRALTQPEDVGPLSKLQAMWRALPVEAGGARKACARMRDFVVELRKKLEARFPELSVPGIPRTAQPFLMYRNWIYAASRNTYNRAALQVEGEWKPENEPAAKKPITDDADPSIASAPQLKQRGPDPDLRVPAGQRARYEAAFARFAADFPDAFYVSERGRYFPDNTRDAGRHLSAGFHNLMGYFRDDQPLYNMILDGRGRRELDELWRELDFIASANIRTYVQFYLFESKEAATGPEGGAATPDADVTSEKRIRKVEEDYLAKARPSGNLTALRAIDEYFDAANAGMRSVERARMKAEPRQLEALQEFAARAYRRPLTEAERAGLIAFYRSLRDQAGLSHEDAMRDSVVSILMSPDFCYRIDVAKAGAAQPLSGYALASRLSYFLWSSMPDAELLRHAAAVDLRLPEVMTAQALRMLRDDRMEDFATEFGGNWLDFRRFEEHNAVDRDRFPTFTDELREAMFQEPVRYILDAARNNRSILDLVYGNYTFVNPALAKHYGMPPVTGGPDHWVRVDNANEYGRGGLLPMAVFLTKNAPGLRTSPVKRGYWVVRRVLGEVIPPPPAVVPELPRDEAKMDLPLRDALARHRQDPMCAACHSRFDSFGLALEEFGPVGERRTNDLGGRDVDARAVFPDGSRGNGHQAIVDYIRGRRQDDFVDNICRKTLMYALGRSLILSDEPLIDSMRTKLIADGYRFGALIEAIVTSPQFLTKRGEPRPKEGN